MFFSVLGCGIWRYNSLLRMHLEHNQWHGMNNPLANLQNAWSAWAPAAVGGEDPRKMPKSPQWREELNQ